MFAWIIGIITGQMKFKDYRKQMSFEKLKRFQFACDCKVYTDKDGKNPKYIPSCKKHIMQIYELNKYNACQEAMNEYYETEITSGYFLVRKCKTCGMFIDSVPDKLVQHLHYLKSSKQQNPNEVKHE